MNETLLIIGPDNWIYVCNLKGIMNGPSEQTIGEISTSFEVKRDLETLESERRSLPLNAEILHL